MASLTPTLSLLKPATPADDGLWGPMVNSNFDAIDRALAAETAARQAFGTFVAPGIGAVDRVPQDKAREQVSVLDFIPVEQHATLAAKTNAAHMGAYINAAIDAVSLAGGGEVLIPPGLYRIALASGSLAAKSNVILRGSGMAVSTILFDDTANTGGYGLVNSGALTDFHLRDIGFRGMGQTIHTVGRHLISLANANHVSVRNCRIEWSRLFGLVIATSDNVLIEGNEVFNTLGDGISVQDTPNLIITNNNIQGANDDCISVHTNDTQTTNPVRGGVVVSNNNIRESQGIKVLGAKAITITGNVMRRMYGYGVYVGYDLPSAQGGTSLVAVDISNNVITDCFKRSETNPRHGVQLYMYVAGTIKKAGPGASTPGTPAAGTGTVTSLYGTGFGNLYANNTDAVGAASAAGWNVRITGNTLMRTLPAPAAISDWGYGASGLFIGDNGVGTGYYNGAISEANMNSPGIKLGGGLSNCLIAGNTIQTGADCIGFDITTADMDYDGLFIRDNVFADVGRAAIFWPTNALSKQRMIIEGNVVDGDPFFRATARLPNGKWSAAGGISLGFYLWLVSGCYVARNHFRNVSTAVLSNAAALVTLQDNVLHANPATFGFSVNNQGVGTCPAPSDDYGYLIEDCDPTSATYGQLLSSTVHAGYAAPTTGIYVIGHFVRNAGPVISTGKVLLGWMRLTTGSAHVAGTDWTPVIGTVT